MRIAFFDCPSGASGDMILASLVDAGVEVARLQEVLETVRLPPFRIESSKQVRGGITGSGVEVVAGESGRPRRYPDVVEMIRSSGLPREVREKSLHVFRILGEAEAKVHRTELDEVHFHEVGALDSIVDVAGAVAGLHLLEVSKVYAGVPATGTGQIEAAHGRLPVPAPATAEILRGRRFRPTEVEGELLTPTGAALLVGLSDSFGPPPPFRLEKLGYGAGKADREDLPNMLRLFLGEREGSLREERVVLLETDVDDISSELLGGLFEEALSAGALDVVLFPTVMKRNRPGHRISLLARPEERQRLARFLLEETGTLGVRCLEVQRYVVHREQETRETRYGPVRFKKASLPGGRTALSPEYRDCLAISRGRKIPLREVWEAVVRDGGEES